MPHSASSPKDVMPTRVSRSGAPFSTRPLGAKVIKRGPPLSPSHVSRPLLRPAVQIIDSLIMSPHPSILSSQYLFSRILKLFVICRSSAGTPSLVPPHPSAVTALTFNSAFIRTASGTGGLTEDPRRRTRAMSEPSPGSPVQLGCMKMSRFLKNSTTRPESSVPGVSSRWQDPTTTIILGHSPEFLSTQCAAVTIHSLAISTPPHLCTLSVVRKDAMYGKRPHGASRPAEIFSCTFCCKVRDCWYI